jgi:hypothetical protein
VKSKYVIFEHNGMNGAVVFSPFLLHKDVAVKGKIKSAGFCKLDANGNWITFGGSASLNISATPRDVDILKELL